MQSRHSLLIALVVTTALVTIALSWAGWRLLTQQQDIDRQRAQEQLGATAEGMAAGIRGKLAETGERLSAAIADTGAGLPSIPAAAVVMSTPDGTVTAARGLPFVPAVPDTSRTDAVFGEGEQLEFAERNLSAAAGRYGALTRHSDGAVRAGALLRLARVAEKRGDTATALRTYQQLEESGDVRISLWPASLVSLDRQHALAKATGDVERGRALSARLIRGLDEGRWLVTRGLLEHYRDALGMTHLPGTWPLADAVERAWPSTGSFQSRGQRVFTDGPRSILVMWRANGSAAAMMAAFTDDFLPTPPREVTWHLADPAGRWIAGEREIPRGAGEPRVVGDSEYAWMLHAASNAVPGGGRRSERTMIAMMAAMLLFLWGAMYFMARAIRREAAVARLQSDFVAAVSHEFRSPLTTIRQMSEMLEMGRITSDERRQAYYGVLTAETSRLQRLVETLLNFGRMEAGAARYRLEDVDLTAVVDRVVGELEASARESGHRIVASGGEAGVAVRGDANALALAVRNLIENALKYSPNQPEVRVECGADAGCAWIRVVDRGIGIPRAEQAGIFEKFVRGRAAIEANVAGTGVGLAIVRQILLAHGGDVAVESEIGRGSVFTLRLPLASSRVSSPNSEEAVVHS